MKIRVNTLVFLVVIVALSACSRKKNTFLNRNWHAITTEYNTLYNGNLALDLGREALRQNYQDFFWDILPVEPLHVSDEVAVPGNDIDPNFAIAEEKAVKAIQRHSMLIDGRERNPQIDEAYLLLGKARYYNQRFLPALEAFNFILHKYPLSNTINEAKVWREKTNIRLHFEEVAIKNLKEILEQEQLEEDTRADASAMLSQAYINLEMLDSAVGPIQNAAKIADDPEEKGRYWFIAGQLFDKLGETDSATQAFNKIIELNRRTSRVYLINAHIRNIQNRSVNSESKTEVLKELEALALDRENRPFLDKIYFQLAEYHYQQDSVELAIDYYNKSLRSPGENSYLQSLDYETLGNIFFDANEYELAGAYFDSTLLKLPPNTREFRLVQRKRDNLDEVIHYENLAVEADSILNLASLSEPERRDYFVEHTQALKEAALEMAEQNDATTANEYFESSRPAMPGVPNPSAAFYFYNPTTAAYGKQEFFRKWGDRKLVDSWRTQNISDTETDLDSVGKAELITTDPRFDPETYLERVPDDPAVLDSIRRERNFANYQLGLIYREKFGENELAATKLESVLENQPEERLILPTKYNLYKIYVDLGERARATAVKNDIIHQFPDSRYAAILQNPESPIEDQNNPSTLYKEVYELYEQQKFLEVIEQSEELISRFSGDEIIPKLELVKAMAEGRLYGLEEYREGLNFVALNYPQSPEGQKAADLLETALPALPPKQFEEDSVASSFKLVIPFNDREQAQQHMAELQEIKSRMGISNSTSVDVYSPEQYFVVIHGFDDLEGLQEFQHKIQEQQDQDWQKNSFYISTQNYRVAQIHKNIETYLNK